MGWFSKKEQVRRDPQTGLMSVKIGGIWIHQTPKEMVLRDLLKYFRDKHMSPGDSIYLSAWVCGFMAGSTVGMVAMPMDNPTAQKLVQQIRDAVAEGIKEGREAQDPAITEEYRKAGGKH